MTIDERIEMLVQAMIPELRVALHDIFENRPLYHMFECARIRTERTISNPLGTPHDITCILTHRKMATIIEHLAKGLRASALERQQ